MPWFPSQKVQPLCRCPCCLAQAELCALPQHALPHTQRLRLQQTVHCRSKAVVLYMLQSRAKRETKERTLGSPGRGRSPTRRVSTTKVFSYRWCSRMVVRRSCAGNLSSALSVLHTECIKPCMIFVMNIRGVKFIPYVITPGAFAGLHQLTSLTKLWPHWLSIWFWRNQTAYPKTDTVGAFTPDSPHVPAKDCPYPLRGFGSRSKPGKHAVRQECAAHPRCSATCWNITEHSRQAARH